MQKKKTKFRLVEGFLHSSLATSNKNTINKGLWPIRKKSPVQEKTGHWVTWHYIKSTNSVQFGKLNGCWAGAVSYLKCVRPFMINDHVRVTGKLAISRHMTYFYMNKWKTYIEFIIFVNTDVWLADRTYYNCFIWMRIWLFENLSLCHAFKTLVFFVLILLNS